MSELIKTHSLFYLVSHLISDQVIYISSPSCSRKSHIWNLNWCRLHSKYLISGTLKNNESIIVQGQDPITVPTGEKGSVTTPRSKKYNKANNLLQLCQSLPLYNHWGWQEYVSYPRWSFLLLNQMTWQTHPQSALLQTEYVASIQYHHLHSMHSRIPE